MLIFPRLPMALLLFLAVQALATSALAAITLTVDSPTPNHVEGPSLSVSVSVSSTYAIQSMSAQTGSVSASLSVPPGQGQPWIGTLAIGSLPYGSQILTITATDALNNTGAATVAYFHHNPPSIQVASPIWSVARLLTRALAGACFTGLDDGVGGGGGTLSAVASKATASPTMAGEAGRVRGEGLIRTGRDRDRRGRRCRTVRSQSSRAEARRVLRWRRGFGWRGARW